MFVNGQYGKVLTSYTLCTYLIIMIIIYIYILQGDVQTAVSMYTVLSNKIKQQIPVDEETLEGWMTAYIGM